MMTGKLRYLSPSGEQFRLLLPSKIIRAFFFWWEKWGDLQWKWRKKPSLPWDALDAAFLLLLLVLLQRHLSSLNPLSEPVSIPRTWAEMLILLTKVNLYVQSGTSRVVSVMLLFVWFWSFCRSEQDHVSLEHYPVKNGRNGKAVPAREQLHMHVKRTNNSQNICHCVWHVTELLMCLLWKQVLQKVMWLQDTCKGSKDPQLKCYYFSDAWKKIILTHVCAGKPSWLLVLWWVVFFSCAILGFPSICVQRRRVKVTFCFLFERKTQSPYSGLSEELHWT